MDQVIGHGGVRNSLSEIRAGIQKIQMEALAKMKQGSTYIPEAPSDGKITLPRLNGHNNSFKGVHNKDVIKRQLSGN